MAVFQCVDAYPWFIAHSNFVLHKDGVCGCQVKGAHLTPSGGDPIQQPDILYLVGGGQETGQEKQH